MSDISKREKKVTIVQVTPHIETDSSISKVGMNNRKRARPIRFCSCASDDEEIEIPSKASKQTVFQDPKFSPRREIYLPTSENGEENEESFSLSPINIKSEPDVPDFEEKTEFAMFTRVFQYLENIQNDIQILKTEQQKIQCQLAGLIRQEKSTFILPTGVSIPVETDEDLLRLNTILKKDKTLTPALARYLYGASFGKSITAFMLNATRKIMTKSVASQYSRLGRKGKKRFEVVDEVYDAILTATSLKFTDAQKEELGEKFGRVLASSCDWEGQRTKNNSACT